jgi:acetyl esterase/lipase
MTGTEAAMKSWSIGLILALLGLSSCTTEPELPYLERRAAFETNLLTKQSVPENAHSPETYPGDWLPLERLRDTTYPSGSFDLKTSVYVPEQAESQRRPALAYFHGGGAWHEGSMRDCRSFVDAGFVVMTPTLRGRNGNPGYNEGFWGEVDDARAAVRWLASQEYVDPDHVYAFGWSHGGAITALLSLMDGVPVQHSGSSGGLFPASIFDKHPVPFDIKNPEERKIRMLVGNLRWMQHRHYAYIGSADAEFSAAIAAAKQEMDAGHGMLEVTMVPGDHMSSIRPAMNLYLEVILEEMGRKPGES